MLRRPIVCVCSFAVLAAVPQTIAVEHVLLIGIDGLSPEGIRRTDTPAMRDLMAHGSYTMRARAIIPTVSSPNWASMLMAAGPEQHGITSNEWERTRLDIPPVVTGGGPDPIFPTIVGELRRARPNALIGIFHDWDGFGRLVERNTATVVEHVPGPEKTVERTAAWRDVLDRAAIWHDPAGSLHLAHADDEAAVLEEFGREACEHGFPCQMLTPIEAGARSPHIRLDNLVAALWSPTEAAVDPRVTLELLPKWLRAARGVTFEFSAGITICEPPRLHAGSRSWIAERIWICSGDDLQTLYPDELGRADLVRCKLQMMRTQPMPWRLGPMLAGGLTLLHYRGFANCPSLPGVRARLERERPDHLASGVHVLVSQSSRGQLTIGDSHEYDEDIEPFDKAFIDDLILGALHELVDVPDLCIEERWHGTYVKHPASQFVVFNPAPGVVAVTGVGGAGMTLSFGLADQVVRGELG